MHLWEILKCKALKGLKKIHFIQEKIRNFSILNNFIYYKTFF